MILRTGTLLVAILLAAPAALAAQRPALRPRPSVLYSLPAAPAPDTIGGPRTYWKEGALLGGIPLGIAGYLLFSGLCDQDDSAGGGRNCGAKGLGGAALGFLIGAVPGALIGGQFHKKD